MVLCIFCKREDLVVNPGGFLGTHGNDSLSGLCEGSGLPAATEHEPMPTPSGLYRPPSYDDPGLDTHAEREMDWDN